VNFIDAEICHQVSITNGIRYRFIGRAEYFQIYIGSCTGVDNNHNIFEQINSNTMNNQPNDRRLSSMGFGFFPVGSLESRLKKLTTLDAKDQVLLAVMGDFQIFSKNIAKAQIKVKCDFDISHVIQIWMMMILLTNLMLIMFWSIIYAV
ncbi:hypothetical protein ACJX0J_033663, partial [Zea mays]